MPQVHYAGIYIIKFCLLSQFTSVKIRGAFPLKAYDPIKSRFYTSYDSYTLITCAKLPPGHLIFRIKKSKLILK